ncbi:MAG: 50S ribosomal protein L23 [Candidatus Kaiserbacteria bacterium]|nr:50S ribosomal protein L23 [Candidatus Kaiserbacteria bacterium]MCB9816673.1 50S ribosomal protein L23 [Candidatus Nomurabacteria bacterium]
MALFGKKKETKEEASVEAPKATAPKALATDRDLATVIVGPRITEKSVMMGDNNVYTFTVRRDATKFDVRDAVKALYNVTPMKVNIVNKKPAKRMVGSRNRAKHVKGVKKAYVYLKKGDTINLV